MRLALSLGRRGWGNTWPNPAVGCVIVKAGRIVGRGCTQPGGRPHAEVVALQQAGEAARELSAARHAAAATLGAAITGELADLGMGAARVEMAVSTAEATGATALVFEGSRLSERGLDHAELLIAPNPGEPASRTTTETPASARRSAAEIPVKPPPMMATSARPSPRNGAQSGATMVSSHQQLARGAGP